jgi:hypothetical protein
VCQLQHPAMTVLLRRIGGPLRRPHRVLLPGLNASFQRRKLSILRSDPDKADTLMPHLDQVRDRIERSL